MSLTLTEANQKTEWLDVTPATSDTGFILEGDFVDPVSVHYSNKPGTKNTNDYIVNEQTFSAKTGLVVPFGVARFVRIASGSVWAAGKTCTIRPGLAMAGREQTFIPTPEGSGNIPIG